MIGILNHPIVLIFDRHLGIINAEMPDQYQNNRAFLSMDLVSTRVQRDLELGVGFLIRVLLRRGPGDKFLASSMGSLGPRH